MSKGDSGLFSGTSGVAVNSTYLTDSSNLESYSERGVDIPEHIKERLSKLQNKGDFIKGSVGEYSMADVSIMSKETGVEFAHVTIGNDTYLIRGDGKSTDIPDRLVKKMIKGGGTWDFHSHPHNDDCVPSKTDTDFMGDLRKLTGQKYSKIVTPNGKTALFDEHGIVETGIVSNHISDERRKALMKLFGGEK